MCELYSNFEWRNPSTGGVLPFNCNSWRCPTCSPQKQHKVSHRLAKYAEEKNLRRFLTLTLSPRSITAEMLVRFYRPEADLDGRIAEVEALLYECSGQEKQENRSRFSLGSAESIEELQQLYWRYISYVWNKYRTMLKRKFPDLSYILIKEPHTKNGEHIRPHLHIMINTYIDIEFIKKTFPKYGGGHQCYIEYIPEDNIKDTLKYIVKYISKMQKAGGKNLYPRGLRRLTVSRDINIKLDPELYETYKQHHAEHGDNLTGDIPNNICVAGHEPEYLDSMNLEPCRQCPYKRAGKCKPYISEWKLYDTHRGFLTGYSRSHDNHAVVHNEMYEKHTKTDRLMYAYDKVHKFYYPDRIRGNKNIENTRCSIKHITQILHGVAKKEQTHNINDVDIQQWSKSQYDTLAMYHEEKIRKYLDERTGNNRNYKKTNS